MRLTPYAFHKLYSPCCVGIGGLRLGLQAVLVERALVQDEHLGVAVRDELGDLCCEQGGGITLIEVVAFF